MTSRPSVEEISVTFVSADLDRQRRVPLVELDLTEVFQFGEVRKMANTHTRTNRIGRYFATTTGTLVRHESTVERGVLEYLDQRGDVVALGTQLLMLHGPGTPRAVWHVPDIIYETVDGTITMANVKERGEHQPHEDLAKAACAYLGWNYELRWPASPTRRQNLEVIAQYRHPLHPDDNIPPALLALLDESSMPLGELAESAGGWATALPIIGHMIWWNQLAIEWEAPLSESTLVGLKKVAA